VSDPHPQYVIRLEHRRLLWFLFVLTLGATGWFAFVLYGESQDFGDDPGRWAFLPSFFWALIAASISVILVVYAIALLVIRERPGQLYRLEDEYATVPEGTPTAPSFLQPQEPAAPDPLAPAEGETPQ
jgi:hypothetical protein